MIDVNGTGLIKFPVDVYLKGNIRWWVGPNINRLAQGSGTSVRDLNLKDWIQWAYDNGHLVLNGSTGGATVSTVSNVSGLNSISSPVEGDIAYINDSNGSGNSGLSVYNGTSWTSPVVSFEGISDTNIANTNLTLTGNRVLSLTNYSFQMLTNGSEMRFGITYNANPSIRVYELFTTNGLMGMTNLAGSIVISTQSGSITLGNSIVNSSTNSLYITATDGSNINIGSAGDGFTIVDNRVTARGLQYSDDYSITFDDRSLVDKQYVDDNIAGIVAGADEKVKVSTNDTTSKTLTEAINAGSPLVMTQINDGGNETVYIQEKSYSGTSKETGITIPTTLNGIAVSPRIKRQLIAGTGTANDLTSIPGLVPVDIALNADSHPVYAYIYGSYSTHDPVGTEEVTCALNTYATTGGLDTTQIVKIGINSTGLYLDALQCDYDFTYVAFLEYAAIP